MGLETGGLGWECLHEVWMGLCLFSTPSCWWIFFHKA